DTPTPSRTLTLSITDGDGGTLQAGGATFAQLTDAANPFEDVAVPFFPGPSFFDADGDGVADLVVGDNTGVIRVFRYDGLGTAATELIGAANPFNGIDVGDVAAPSFFDIDGDGDLDLLAGTYGGRIVAYQNNGVGSFTELGFMQNPFNGVQVANTASIAFVDLDEDGDQDAVIGSQNGATIALRNDGPGNPWVELTGTDNPFSAIGGFDVRWAFVDLDGDGDLDGVQGSSGFIGAYQNNGAGNPFTLMSGADNPFQGVNLGGSLISPAAVDLDGDGDLDVVFTRGDGEVFTFLNNPRGAPITISVTPENEAPTSTGFDDVTFLEGQPYVLLDTGFDQVLTDTDSSDFDGGSLTIQVTGNAAAAEDAFGLLTGGTSFLAISGNSVSYGGVIFATFDDAADGDPGESLAFNFNADASIQAVQTLMRNLVYANVNQVDPSTAPRTVEYILTDGDGGTLTLNSTIDLVGVNDAPSGTDATITATEDTPLVLTAADFGFTDVDGNSLDAVRITTVPGTGALYYDI
ncbi:MAG: hypothetical protein EON96_11240, partial [Caulobacteraceae bacterium]